MSKNKKKFYYDFEDESPGQLSYQCTPTEKEKIDLEIVDGQAYLFGNKEGLINLAKICIKLSLGNYPDGLHLHINKNFIEEEDEVLCIGVEPNEKDIL